MNDVSANCGLATELSGCGAIIGLGGLEMVISWRRKDHVIRIFPGVSGHNNIGGRNREDNNDNIVIGETELLFHSWFLGMAGHVRTTQGRHTMKSPLADWSNDGTMVQPTQQHQAR